MPWCATCDRFLSPPSVTPEGNCPNCGRPVEAGQAHPPRQEQEAPPTAEDDIGPVPAHLKILGVALVVYLGWRFFQGVEWVIQRLS